MSYENHLGAVNEGQWPKILDKLNEEGSAPFVAYVFKGVPRTYGKSDCVTCKTISEGDHRRVSLKSIRSEGIKTRVSMRVLAYLRDTGELRQFPLPPTCGNPACINPKHQYVYGVSTPPGRSGLTHEQRAISESRSLIRKMVQAAMQSGGSEVVIPIKVAALALGVSAQ